MKLIIYPKPPTMNWLFMLAAVPLYLLLSIFFSSCAVVKTDFSKNVKKNATVYYYLPETVLKIHVVAKVAVLYDNTDNTLSESPQLLEENFTVTTENIADTRTLLTLNYKANAFMTDEIKYTVNKKGLLETIEVKTEDRTADIIAKLADAPKTILGTASTTRAAGFYAKIKEFAADFTLRTSAITNDGIIVPWIIPITNEVKNDNYVLADASFKVKTTTPFQIPIPEPSSFLASPSTTEVDGILTRPLINFQLEFQPASATIEGVRPVEVPVADLCKLIEIPVRRTAFAKRETKISMADGLITGHEIKNPSAAEGFISIPINIAKAIVSIPAQLITFKIDNTKKLTELEKEKLNLEKSLQEAQKFSLTKETEIEKVKLEILKAGLSSEYALKTLKLDLEKSLLESEKKQLEALKGLQQIKEELENLKKNKNGN